DVVGARGAAVPRNAEEEHRRRGAVGAGRPEHRRGVVCRRAVAQLESELGAGPVRGQAGSDRFPLLRNAHRAKTSTACVVNHPPRLWYLVSDFDRGRDFYKRMLGFDETFVDWGDKWSKLERGSMRIALAQGEPTLSGGVAAIDVDD